MANILAVDDSHTVLTLYSIILQQQGHSVATAFSGAEAEVLFDKHDFALVVTDFDMPGVKGDELSVRLKIKKPKCPIIMISSSPEPKSHKADIFLSKPISTGELVKAINSLLKK